MDTAKITEIVLEVLAKITADQVRQVEKGVLIILESNGKAPPLLDAALKISGRQPNTILFLGEPRLKCDLPQTELIILPSDLPDQLEEWVKQFELILLPAPSLKTISKLAHVIIDETVLEIIFLAVALKKKIILNQTNDEYMHLPAALQQETQKFLTKIRSFGLEIRDFNLVNLDNQSAFLSKPITKLKNKPKQVLTVDDIVAGVQGCIFRVKTESLLTPLAQDYIKEHRIQIIT